MQQLSESFPLSFSVGFGQCVFVRTGVVGCCLPMGVFSFQRCGGRPHTFVLFVFFFVLVCYGIVFGRVISRVRRHSSTPKPRKPPLPRHAHDDLPPRLGVCGGGIVCSSTPHHGCDLPVGFPPAYVFFFIVVVVVVVLEEMIDIFLSHSPVSGPTCRTPLWCPVGCTLRPSRTVPTPSKRQRGEGCHAP